jgi:predicted Ser/Thr protein kinase
MNFKQIEMILRASIGENIVINNNNYAEYTIKEVKKVKNEIRVTYTEQNEREVTRKIIEDYDEITQNIDSCSGYGYSKLHSIKLV